MYCGVFLGGLRPQAEVDAPLVDPPLGETTTVLSEALEVQLEGPVLHLGVVMRM